MYIDLKDIEKKGFFTHLDNTDLEKKRKPGLYDGNRKAKDDCIHKKIFANFFKSIRKSINKNNSGIKLQDLLLRIEFTQNVTKKNVVDIFDKTLLEIYNIYAKFPEKWEAIKSLEYFKKIEDNFGQPFFEIYNNYLNHEAFQADLNKIRIRNSEEYVHQFEEKARNFIKDSTNKKNYKKRKSEDESCSSDKLFE